MMEKIEIRGLTKKYKKVTALDNIDMDFEKGKIYALLGRIGAGESTLIDTVANRIFADEGYINIDGIPATENPNVHEKIFCMSEKDMYDSQLRIRELFKWIDKFYDSFDVKKAYKLSKRFSLNVDSKLRSLSKGYQSIFKLIVALSIDVPYVIFDEPVLGLDAFHRDLFYKIMLEEYEKKERTYIIATHLIEEIENIIEEVVIIDKGKVQVQSSVDELIGSGYSVSGLKETVDRYCHDKNVIGYDTLHDIKIAYILGDKTKETGWENLNFSGMSLQKIFIKMTGDEGEI